MGRDTTHRGRTRALVATLLAASVVLLGGVASGAEQPSRGAPAAGDGSGTFRAGKLGDFKDPVFVTGPKGARGLRFVVERAGKIIAVGPNGGTRTFLNITGPVNDGGSEQGLLSVAFSPKYSKSRRFYVYYTDQFGDIVIAEYRRSAKNPRRARSKSARKVITVRHRLAENHNGGQVEFGPDGFLYFGTGDGGGGGDPDENAQDRDSLLGKLIRINPRQSGDQPYTIPISNPFVGQPGRDEIYSYGLRNPYRFSFDRLTGSLSIGDVGQETWEEVNYLSPSAAGGANFGWDAYEGFGRYNSRDASPIPAGPVTSPIHQYQHVNGNCSITGGYVSRDPRTPSLNGRYLYADYCKSQIRSLIPSAGGASDDKLVGIPSIQNISSFGEDTKGRIYVASLSEDAVYVIKP